MAESRYAWSRHTWQENAFELRKRAKADPGCVRTLTKDAHARCLVRSCGKAPKRDEICYYPARTVNADNEIIAHKECIESFCAEYTAKSTKDAREQSISAKGLVPIAAAVKDLKPTLALDAQSVLAKIKAKLKRQVWDEAYRKGREDQLAELMAALGETDDSAQEAGH